jgi:hypothetical protein
MKYAKAILLTIAVGVLLDILIDVLIPDHVMNLVFLVTMSVLLLGVLLVAFGTLTKNRWGINLEPVNCPACGSPMPKVRRPGVRLVRCWGVWGWSQVSRPRQESASWRPEHSARVLEGCDRMIW